MAEVIGVRFKNTGKVYYFDPQGIQVEKGSMAIVETARGLECGEVALQNREVADESIVQPLRRLIRLATPEDLKKVAENHIKEKKAFRACEKKIAERGLEMKLVDVEYTFDNSKILFYFTADGRVDFRSRMFSSRFCFSSVKTAFSISSGVTISFIAANISSGIAQLVYSCFGLPHSATILSINWIIVWFTSWHL